MTDPHLTALAEQISVLQPVVAFFEDAWKWALKQAVADQREADAQIAEVWANSKSCKHHDNDPCCHIRTGAGIAAAIRHGSETE
jgi:hypothetical protein